MTDQAERQAFDIAIDIGDAQPDIDWGALAESPIVFVMIKATEGPAFISKTFGAQLAGALKAGKRVIPYHFMRPGSADAQVKNFTAATRLAKNQPYALDWEGRAAQTATPQIAEGIGTQLAALTGRLPLGYWGIKGSTPAAPTAAMDGWDRWVPRYPRSGAKSFADLGPTFNPDASPRLDIAPAQWESRWPGALFAQYTCWGQVPGIKVPVDRSAIFANSLNEALAWYATGARLAA